MRDGKTQREYVRDLATECGWEMIGGDTTDIFRWPGGTRSFTPEQCLWEPGLAHLSPLPVQPMTVPYNTSGDVLADYIQGRPAMDDGAVAYAYGDEFGDPGGYGRVGLEAYPTELRHG